MSDAQDSDSIPPGRRQRPALGGTNGGDGSGAAAVGLEEQATTTEGRGSCDAAPCPVGGTHFPPISDGAQVIVLRSPEGLRAPTQTAVALGGCETFPDCRHR